MLFQMSCTHVFSSPGIKINVLWWLFRSAFILQHLGALTQAIRNFAKSLEGWLSNAMNNIPQRMIQTKVGLYVFAFSSVFRKLYWAVNFRSVLLNGIKYNIGIRIYWAFQTNFLFVLCNHVIKDFHKRCCLIMLLSKKLEKHFTCGVFISLFPEYIFQIA